MRFSYSAHAASAQSGSLPPSATTWSLATRLFLHRTFFLLRDRLLRRRFHLHFLAAPDLFQVVEAAHRGMHDVHHHVAEVDEHPFAGLRALHAVDARAERGELLLHVV